MCTEFKRLPENHRSLRNVLRSNYTGSIGPIHNFLLEILELRYMSDQVLCNNLR